MYGGSPLAAELPFPFRPALVTWLVAISVGGPPPALPLLFRRTWPPPRRILSLPPGPIHPGAPLLSPMIGMRPLRVARMPRPPTFAAVRVCRHPCLDSGPLTTSSNVAAHIASNASHALAIAWGGVVRSAFFFFLRTRTATALNVPFPTLNQRRRGKPRGRDGSIGRLSAPGRRSALGNPEF